MLFCVDTDRMCITKFDCPCKPTGASRYEFKVDSTNLNEVMATAKSATGLSDLKFCDHFSNVKE